MKKYIYLLLIFSFVKIFNGNKRYQLIPYRDKNLSLVLFNEEDAIKKKINSTLMLFDKETYKLLKKTYIIFGNFNFENIKLVNQLQNQQLKHKVNVNILKKQQNIINLLSNQINELKQQKQIKIITTLTEEDILNRISYLLRKEKTKDLIQFINTIKDIELINKIKNNIKSHYIEKNKYKILEYILSRIP